MENKELYFMQAFQFKPFNEMTGEDYTFIGFKSGLEIHQQLLTKKKLFCRCPAGIYSNKYNAEILRHMRPTLSEFGEYDGTALMEFKTRKDIVYQINRDTVCTYEMDDTPPFEINEEALDIALQIGLLYECNIVDEIHISRKQYLDGSIPTGFQRTSIFALDGKIPYKNREIKIVQLSIEEDACREVSDIGHTRVYLTDRLGMPLVETVTAPEMRTPQEVAEVAEICRKLVKSIGKVRTGIGAARQDVNVSVTGGTRIEIKGVPKIPLIPLLTYNEAMRQWNLLRLRDELNKRGITADTFSSRTEDITSLMKKTNYLPLMNAAAQGMKVKCVVLKGYRGLLHWETQTDTYFSKEISDRVRVVACLTTIPNIIHSDSKGDNITSSEWFKIKKYTGVTDDDTLVVVWGSEKDIDTAANEIVIRAREAAIGVPSETRQALRDGTNGFERILPGPDRMYPDTDLPPRKINPERLSRLTLNLPQQFWIREKWYNDLQLPKDIIEPLAISPYAALFEFLVKEWNINPVLAGTAIIHFPKRLGREGYNSTMLTPDILRKIFDAFRIGLISREGILIAMRKALKHQEFSFEMLEPVCSDEELSRVVNEAQVELQRISLRNSSKRTEVLTGLVMKKVRGRIKSTLVLDKIKSISKEKADAL